jgi:hypothetical protein
MIYHHPADPVTRHLAGKATPELHDMRATALQDIHDPSRAESAISSLRWDGPQSTA